MFEIPEPQGTAPITSARGRRADDGPNPFIDNGWLWAQYEAVKTAEENKQSVESLTKSVTVAGGWENRQATNKQREPQFDPETGEPIMIDVLIGDAAQVVRMLRKAADLHEIGVSIQAVQAMGPRGKELKGQVEVKYLAKDRKVKKSGDTE